MMEAKTMSCFPLKSDQQGLELVNPSEGSLTDKAALVHNRVEMSFASPFDCLSIALVLRNVGLDTTIPQHLPCGSSVKAAIGVEDGTFVDQSTSLHVSKDVLQLLNKLVSIIMIAGNDTCRRENVAISIGYREDIAGLCLLSSLVGDFFAPFFAALWLPSRLSSDKFNSPLMVIILASKRRWRLPSLLHLRK
jgi:hypothetical protein